MPDNPYRPPERGDVTTPDAADRLAESRDWVDGTRHHSGWRIASQVTLVFAGGILVLFGLAAGACCIGANAN